MWSTSSDSDCCDEDEYDRLLAESEEYGKKDEIHGSEAEDKMLDVFSWRQIFSGQK